MAIVETILEAVWKFAMKNFGALQVCWLCLASTLGIGWLMSTTYARATDLASLSAELVEIKADTIAKRIFDYRVRQCDTPPEQRQEKRWLAEQIRADVEKYSKVTGKPFAVPGCADL